MASKVDSGRISPPPGAISGGSPTTSSKSAGGVGAGGSSTSSLGNAPVTRSWGPKIRGALWFIPSQIAKFFSHVTNWCLEKVYGKGRTPAQTVEVEIKGWFGRKYIEKMSLDAAIEGKYLTTDGSAWTAEYAVANGKCNEDYVKTRGWNLIEFDYKGYTGVTPMKIKAKSAVRDGYFTWEALIARKDLTRDQAERGGFVKKPVAPAAATAKK